MKTCPTCHGSGRDKVDVKERCPECRGYKQVPEEIDLNRDDFTANANNNWNRSRRV